MNKAGRPAGPAPTFQCEFCGEIKERYLCRTKDGKHSSYNKKQRFCGKECGYKGRRWRPINPNGYRHSTGYMVRNLRGGGKILIQRAVMTKALGRPLHKHENVHHKNGDRTDNSLTNLELWSKRQPAGQRVVDKIAFAIDMLRLYPEFARAAGVELREVEQVPVPFIAEFPESREPRE